MVTKCDAEQHAVDRLLAERHTDVVFRAAGHYADKRQVLGR